MGRHVTGPDGFQYKYVFGEQPTNLAWLAGRSGAGAGRMVFDYFVADQDGEEDQYGDGDGQTKGLGPAAAGGFVSPIRGIEVKFEEDTPIEVVGLAVVKLQEGLAKRLRARFTNATSLRMEACAEYELRKKDHPKLLAYVSRFLPKGKTLTLEQLGDLDEESLHTVLDARKVAKAEWLPLLALCMLAHAVKHGGDKAIFGDDEAEWEYQIWPREDDADASEPPRQRKPAGKKDPKAERRAKASRPARENSPKKQSKIRAAKKPARRRPPAG